MKYFLLEILFFIYLCILANGIQTKSPSTKPNLSPSVIPTIKQSYVPTRVPTSTPSKTKTPSKMPSKIPSLRPSKIPSVSPYVKPSYVPTRRPTIKPSIVPSKAPFIIPTYPPSLIPIAQSQVGNSGFEKGLTNWKSTGNTSIVSTGCYVGVRCAMVGAVFPTKDSSIEQTFLMANHFNFLSFWYKMTCPDTISYDWATATLYDNTLGTLSWTMKKICPGTSGMSWTSAAISVIPGHSYTLTLINHDDNFSSDPSYTLFDNITMFSGTVPPSVVPTFSPTAAPSMSPVAFTSSLRFFSAVNKCLDIPNNNQVSGQSLDGWDCNGGNAQTFTFTPLSVGTYKITSSQGLCVHVAGALTTNGAVVDLQTCNGQPNQMWTVNDLGNNLFHLQPVNGISLNKCLDNASGSTANGNKIEIWDCNNNPASETWSFSMPLVTGKIFVKVYYFCVP